MLKVFHSLDEGLLVEAFYLNLITESGVVTGNMGLLSPLENIYSGKFVNYLDPDK